MSETAIQGPAVGSEVLKKISEGLADKQTIVADLEAELFGLSTEVTKFPKLGRREKIELYELARNGLHADINLLFKISSTKQALDNETQMLVSILSNLPNDLRPAVAAAIRDIVTHREKYTTK